MKGKRSCWTSSERAGGRGQASCGAERLRTAAACEPIAGTGEGLDGLRDNPAKVRLRAEVWYGTTLRFSDALRGATTSAVVRYHAPVSAPLGGQPSSRGLARRTSPNVARSRRGTVPRTHSRSFRKLGYQLLKRPLEGHPASLRKNASWQFNSDYSAFARSDHTLFAVG